MIAVHPAPISNFKTLPDLSGKFYVASDPGNLGGSQVRYLGRDGLWYQSMGPEGQEGRGHYFDSEQEAKAAMEKVL